MKIIICPGIHPPQLTEKFLENLGLDNHHYLVFPDHQQWAFSPEKIVKFINQQAITEELFFLAFSAGVVGAFGAALHLQKSYLIKGLIALDGWGMPLYADFPIYRLSHDYFTHWSSNLLGAGEQNFYADPSVSHLDLWSKPHQVQGWQTLTSGCRVRLTAQDFLQEILE
jgi:hypothetical protein